MANLIITIISIGLFAIAAIMGAYYGGQAFQNAQLNAMASTLLSQSQQVMAANTQYMLNNGLSSFDDFTDYSIFISSGKYVVGQIPILSLPTHNTLVAAITNCPVNVTDSSINGYLINGTRSHANLFGNNAIIYNFFSGTVTSNCGGLGSSGGGAIDFSLAANANHPLVKICKQINTINGFPQSGFTVTASGLPYSNAHTGDIFYSDSNSSYHYINDPTAVGFCVLAQSPYWGTGYDEIILVIE